MTATQPAESLQENTNKILLEKVRSASFPTKQPKTNNKDWNNNIVKEVSEKTIDVFVFTYSSCVKGKPFLKFLNHNIYFIF